MDDYDLYLTILRVVEVVFEELERCVEAHPDDPPKLTRVKYMGPNHCYHQTETGFFLEYDGAGFPNVLWTPWGKLHLHAGCVGLGTNITEIGLAVKERLGLTIFLEEEITRYSYSGPVYAVRKVDDQELPEPAMRPAEKYLSYEEVKAAWTEFETRAADPS